MKQVYYYIIHPNDKVDPEDLTNSHKSTDIDEKTYDEYSNIIRQTLQDSRGWKKYQFDFQEVKRPDRGVINIKFRTGNNMSKLNERDENFSRLSAYSPMEHTVYFNLDNWNSGKTWDGDEFPQIDDESGLTRYRQYVINHELGHALGLLHPTKTRGPVSVMEQNTKGLTWLNRKLYDKKTRTYNCWPLDKNIFNEVSSIVGGTYNDGCYKILLGSITCCVLLLLCIIYRSVIYRIAHNIYAKIETQVFQLPL